MDSPQTGGPATWHPCAALDTLKQSGRLRRTIRQWMDGQQVLEVTTPSLSRAAATDPHVMSVGTNDNRFLHTSPEFPMKRLLAAYACDIYQIAPVFRAGESGRYHNTEFTLLEWYRVGFDHVRLMDDVVSLLQALWNATGLDWPGVEKCAYGERVKAQLGSWPEELTTKQVRDFFVAHDRSFPASIMDDVDAAMDLFMDEFVIPTFTTSRFTFLTDYPVSQSALARIGQDVHGRAVAERFELYANGVELANGFHELTDAGEQRKRFTEDLHKRQQLGVPAVPIDNHLLAALESGMPACAGVALGLDRLLMVAGQHDHIRHVLSFDDQRA